jgi:hypothetical protein
MSDMLSTLESGPFNDPLFATLRDWIKKLHSYSHVDTLSLFVGLSPGGAVVWYPPAPALHEKTFIRCAAAALVALGALVISANSFRVAWGFEPVECQTYVDEVSRLQTDYFKTAPASGMH